MSSAGAFNGSRSRLGGVLLTNSRGLQKGIFSRSSPFLASRLAVPSFLGSAGLASLSGPAVCHVASLQDPLGHRCYSAEGVRVHGLRRSPGTKIELPFAVRGLAGPTNEGTPVTAEDASKAVDAVVEGQKDRIRQEGLEVEENEYWGIVPKKRTREDGSDWPWHSFRPQDSYVANVSIDLNKTFKPQTWEDRFAYYLVKILRIPTDIFFQTRYGCRAMMLETVAAVPGMVAGMLLHLKSLRRFEHTGGWIRALLDEAENERMHLMTMMEVAQPKWYERALVLAVQGVFFNVYFVVYLLNPRLAHRVVGYLEEEAVHSYTEFLKELDAGRIKNIPAPLIAIDYWRLPKDATLRDVVLVVRADEAHHRDVNHFASNVLKSGKKLSENPAPVDYH